MLTWGWSNYSLPPPMDDTEDIMYLLSFCKRRAWEHSDDISVKQELWKCQNYIFFLKNDFQKKYNFESHIEKLVKLQRKYKTSSLSNYLSTYQILSS